MNRAVIKELILKLIARFGVAVTGLRGFVIKWFVEKFLVVLEKYLRNEWQKHLDRKAKAIDEKNAQKLKDVLESPNKTEADIDQATSDFLNGRKPK